MWPIAAILVIMLAVVAVQQSLAHNADAALTRLRAATAAAADPSCATVAKSCCPEPCIRYIDRPAARRAATVTCCDSCKPPVKSVLKVMNPVTCCPVDVPVCLPACCEGCPAIDSRCGLLCRGTVTYDWCCGYRVVVRFDRCGDVTVVYRG